MDSDQESSECPLCLEVLEADDLNFFPCTCCYQICRFCWHRIRTDENGLCPACRKPYSENPAQFKPLTDEEIQQVKRDRKLKESNKKPKVTESRKHLANLRVVQRNLVFVNGLPARLADTELLRRNDHFGKYGKIVKLVTSPAHNGQVNSICVYITYSRSEEALRAIQALCNYHVDGRTLKATLGTTKYCSRYLKGASCQKADCLYLHEPGDPLASFTKEQMQQGLHLEYERKLMEQYTNKHSSGQSNTTPKNGRTNINGNKTDSSHRRKTPHQATSSTSAISANGNSDFESGDETHHHHHSLNGYTTETFTSTTAINVDSDTTSTSSQTSSEHDPHVTSSTNTTNQTQTYNNISPTTNWSDDRASIFTANNLAASQPPSSSTTTKPSSQISPSINLSVTNNLCSPKINSNPNNNLLTESSNNNNTVKTFDQVPEYKLFSTNIPSIHNLFFANNENGQQSHRPLINGIDHDVREIEKRLMENGLNNGDSSSYSQIQENDELGFDPCSLFMSALAPDIEDERRPLPSAVSYRPTTNSYNYATQYPPSTTTTNSSMGHINPAWLTQQQQQQQQQQHQQYQHYHDQQTALHSNGTTPQKQQPQLPPPPQQQQQQRYPMSFNGSSPRQMWNGNQQPQYASQMPTRLDFNNQIQQRLPPRQSSPSSNQYSQSIPPSSSTNNPNTYSSNSTVTSNDRWINLPWTDPAIISYGTKLDPSPSQWSTTTQSQGSSTLSSGNNLIPTARWSQHQSTQSQSHMIPNGIYSPYSTTSGVDDGNRS